jgi:endonuclease YncB( thermonuclease family)
MTRYQAYGAQANEALENAIKLDPNNPRIYLVDGQYKMNVPEAFGGGKEVGKKLFTKSLELFKTFKPASEMHPSWGKEQAEKLLETVNK